MDRPTISEMDVSRVDPEEVLVDFETIDAGDISTELVEVEDMLQDYGAEDKVLVSIRSVYISNLFAFSQIDEVYTPVSSGFARRKPLLSGTIRAVISH